MTEALLLGSYVVYKLREPFSCALLITLVVGALILAGNVHVGTVEAATDVTGIISSDVTWTKQNSPYSLTGPMLVNSGVTLTIESGVTVYLNEHDITVNGTLVARGSSADKIRLEVSSVPFYYSGGEIEFTSFSGNWDEQAGSGCIIENTIVNTRLSISNSPKISNNFINASISINGTPQVTISGNTVTKPILVSRESSAIISNNDIVCGGDYSSIITVSGGSAVISNNNITGNGTVGTIGISFEGGTGVQVSDNIISGFKNSGISAAGAAVIERNLIFGNNYGITIGESVALGMMIYGDYSDIVIRNNTIKDNSYGIYGATSNTTIIYNNIQNNSDYNIGIRYAENITVTNNWWGTTDTQAINQTMFDFTKDYRLGTITFIPFLTEPVPEETATPIPEFPPYIILPLLFTATLIVVFFRKRLVNTTDNS